MLVDGEGVGHGLNGEVVGADERKGPVLLLQLLNHRADHLQRPFFAAVLLAIGDDGHQHMVAFLNLGADLRSSLLTLGRIQASLILLSLNRSLGLGDTLADGIVERSAATGTIGFPVQVLGLCSGQVVVVPGGVASIEGEQGDELFLVRELLLHLADSLQGLVHAYEGLLADNFHRTALIDNNQVVNSLHRIFHNRNFLNGEYLI